MGNETPTISIAIIGAGGLGVSTAWQILENWPTDIELQLEIYDSDVIELSNLNRQILFAENDIGKVKSEVLKERLSEKFPQFDISSHCERISESNLDSELKGISLIVDASDSPATTFMLNDFCVQNSIPFSYAGVLGLYGQSLLVAPMVNQTTACLRCLFGNVSDEEIAKIGESCQTAGILGAVAAKISLLQANSILSFLFGNYSQRSRAKELKRFSFSEFKTKSSPTHAQSDCPNRCSEKKLVSLDLRDKQCPQTFILSKLALEQVDVLQGIEAQFECVESFQKVRTSLETELAETRFFGKVGDSWRLGIFHPPSEN